MEISEREFFIKKTALDKIRELKENSPALWGKMNASQMVEHLSEYIEHANGKRKMQVLTEQEKLPAFRSFLFSEKEFKPGTPNSQMPETPEQPRLESLEAAIEELEINLYKFFERFAGKENETENHIFFGPLNYEEYLTLLYKHVLHHLKQFGLS
jgi:hypothetical protein